MRIFNLFITTAVSALLILFLFSWLCSAPATQAGKNPRKAEKEKNFKENEIVARIDSPEAAERLAKEKKYLITPLSSGGEDRDFYLVKSLEQKPVGKISKELEKDPSVSLAQPNFRYRILDRTTNDPYFPRQWSLFDTSSTGGGVSAFSAWNTESKNQRNVVVAVIDTGVNAKHKDLRKNLAKGSASGKNFENRKKKPSDSDGHGTFLSGIIGARVKNKRGLAGASYFNHLRIMALKFDFTTSQAIAAINYARSKNVPIVNASWGAYGEDGLDLALKDAIAGYPGVFVTASGNSGSDHDGENLSDKMYPCDFDLPNIICVGASDRNGNLADYSDYGSFSVDVVAPGGTDGDEIVGLAKKKSGYTSAEGSSLSTAYVSAEAGLIISKYPHLSGTQVIEIIKNSVDAAPSLADKVATEGKINFQKALELAASY